MKRGYTSLEYKSIVRRLRRARPGISITSDFIVGFPGETDADFAATMALIDEVGFDNSFSFLYSPRPGTPAASLQDDTPHDVKAARLEKLQAAIAANETVIGKNMVGTTQRVMVERQSKKALGELAGRTDNNRIVNFPGPALHIGSFMQVRITGNFAHSLRGEAALPAAATDMAAAHALAR